MENVLILDTYHHTPL